jgi:GNAT superfamily N-acetyltransferase
LSGSDTKVLPALRIAPLLPEHAGEALTVQRAAYVTEAQRYAAPMIPPLVETLDELRADLAAGVLARGAWLGPRLVGSVRGRVDGERGSRMEVLRFSVAPDVQGRGVGRALLTAVHAAAPPTTRVIWLVTGARSPENLHLYTSAGYRIVGTVTDAAGVGLVRMELDRPPGTVGAQS